jgi:urea transport system permease protein
MDDYTYEEIYSIVVMQSFSGISLMCIFILMGLGLYIIFGQMGVINMAHAEFRLRLLDLCFSQSSPSYF